ncbi:MAG: hypothetical protein K2X38_23825 [Gemmataceae bacterium]|nr:hypothetical protein [Gemmataceae bacterium]
MIRILSIAQHSTSPPIADVTYQDAPFAFEYLAEKCGQKGWLIERLQSENGAVTIRIDGATADELAGIFERDAANFIVERSA